MKHLHKMIAGLCLAFLGGCGVDQERPEEPTVEDTSDNRTIGGLKPFREMNRLVGERLFLDPATLNLADYFQDPVASDDVFAAFDPSLADLLGGFEGDGLRNELVNTTPNSINMLLWYLAIDGLATELSAACVENGDATKFSLTDVRMDILGALRTFCETVSQGATPFDDDLRTIWTVAMRGDAPEAEYFAWKEMVLDGHRLVQNGEMFQTTLAKEIVVGALYNPYFMLKK